jgi:hypothetical protein
MMKHESGLSLLPTSRAFSQAAKIFFIYKHFSILWSFELSGWLFIMENTSFNENEIERNEKWQNFLLGFVAIFLVKGIFSMANVKRVRRRRGKLNVVLERVNERKLQVLVSLTRSPSTFAIFTLPPNVLFSTLQQSFFKCLFYDSFSIIFCENSYPDFTGFPRKPSSYQKNRKSSPAQIIPRKHSLRQNPTSKQKKKQ